MFPYCGIDCDKCEWRENCKGCAETSGKPFGGGICPQAECCIKKEQKSCSECADCKLKNDLIAEFNGLKIDGMPEIRELYMLGGSIVNMAYPLPGGETAKFWNDSNIYFGNQVEKTGSERCFGLAADVNYLMVSEYGENGADPQIVIFKKR